MWHFDANVYGSPQSDLSQSQRSQFSRTVGDVGRGLYKSDNPTGAIPVKLTYRWDGDTLAQFRSDWKSPSKMLHGAHWFTMDLPLMLDHSGVADTTLFPFSQAQDTVFVFAVTPEQFGDEANGYRGGGNGLTLYGAMSPQTMLGVWIGRVLNYRDTFLGNMIIGDNTNGGAGIRMPGNEDGFMIRYSATGETSQMIWDNTNFRYEQTTPTPVAAGKWNTERIAHSYEVHVRTQPYQRYRCHVTDMYDATLIGYDYWEVTLPVEVDVSPALVIGGP